METMTSNAKPVIQTPRGPDSRVKFTEQYAKHVARDAYFWAWPLVNLYNRRLFYATIKDMEYAGALPRAPLNTFAMLTDYIEPAQRSVACPNQDVVYGAGYAALDISPVIVQVPDFGDRFWVYQIVDLRTDSFTQIGKMYDTPPGFYLLAGPNWQGEKPEGVTKVFRSSTNTAFVGRKQDQRNHVPSGTFCERLRVFKISHSANMTAYAIGYRS